jgi:hypothetical protein
MIKNVYRLKIIWALFIWVLEKAPGLPPRLDLLLIRPWVHNNVWNDWKGFLERIIF